MSALAVVGIVMFLSEAAAFVTGQTILPHYAKQCLVLARNTLTAHKNDPGFKVQSGIDSYSNLEALVLYKPKIQGSAPPEGLILERYSGRHV